MAAEMTRPEPTRTAGAEPFSVLLHNGHARAILVTKEQSPELYAQIGEHRRTAYAHDAEIADEWFGLDEYDEFYKQLAVVDDSTGKLIAAMRLGLGDEVLLLRREQEFYTEKFWHFHEEMIELAKRGVEITRMWVAPSYRRRRAGLSLLWEALAHFLENRSYSFLFGIVDLVEFPMGAQQMVLSYLNHFHRNPVNLVTARHAVFRLDLSPTEEASREQAFLRLTSDLKSQYPQHPLPVLLRQYIRFGVVLAGDCDVDANGQRVRALMMFPLDILERSKKWAHAT